METIERDVRSTRTGDSEVPLTWDGEEIAEDRDPQTGARLYVFVHSTRLGPAGGGTRMRVYANEAEAVTDGRRLAAGMTRKMAVAGMPFGGGKAVISVPRLPAGEDRKRLLHLHGDLISSLGGSFWTGPDMNTSPADMDVIAERCPYVFFRTEANGGSGGSAPSTALGVFHGIRATVERAFGSADLTGRTVLVQGVGSVGARLASLLAEAGASVSVSDIDMTRATTLARKIGASVVEPEAVIGAEVDVYAPCAIGGVLNADSIPQLRCPVVAGAANNQFWEPEDAARLQAREIVYAPDYVINAGGAIHGIGLEILGWSSERLAGRLEGIGDTLRRIYEIADAEEVTTEAAAQRLADDRLRA